MPRTVDIAAARFVDLVLKYEQWEGAKLTADEVQVLFEVVAAAGFEPKTVVPGKLRGDYLEQDGTRSGQTYPINIFCPFKVVSQENSDHYFATGWLDCALCRIARPPQRFAVIKEDRDELIGVIIQEIERSVPLQPVQLTLEGDLLCEYPPSKHIGFTYFVDHTRDDHELEHYGGIGIHDNCDGWVDRVPATKTHDALLCRNCHLRVLFSRETKTYGELRQALASKFVQVPA